MSAERLIMKLSAFGPLSASDKDAIRSLGGDRVRRIGPGKDLISEGDNPQDVYLITKGWGCRYKMLDDGRRQILSCFVPGDLCDLFVYVLRAMDHSVAAMTPVEYLRVSPSEIEALGDNHPRVLRALWWDSLVTDAIQREWLMNAGQRDAQEAAAQLMCELYIRQRLVGLVDGRTCAFPLTQQDIGDALGLTGTHVGRVLRKISREGVVTLRNRQLTIHDWPRLKAMAHFNPNYLHRPAD